MTKEKALKDFLGNFDIPAYPQTAVPTDVTFPYLTYEPVIGTWEDGEIGITVNLWYYTSDEAPPNAKAREMSEKIGMGGKTIPCDGGLIWIKRGSPWCQNLSDDADMKIKRRYINISVEYLTLN